MRYTENTATQPKAGVRVSDKKKYPDWADFDADKIGYGLARGGIGVYTYDGKYFWPDEEGTMPEEWQAWFKRLESQGYEIPERYKQYQKKGRGHVVVVEKSAFVKLTAELSSLKEERKIQYLRIQSDEIVLEQQHKIIKRFQPEIDALQTSLRQAEERLKLADEALEIACKQSDCVCHRFGRSANDKCCIWCNAREALEQIRAKGMENE